MRTQNFDIGVIQVVLLRLESQRLPRIIEIKQRLDLGNTLNEFEIDYLSQALFDTRAILPYLDKHPEYIALLTSVIHCYKVITDEALGNENSR